ncbi:efflux RND transporter periplasmic adaptor subunit [Streptomyces sp. NPDC097619]|uniref:efflux RND transporter periplasmic adaptor subunit n=1 Tax=Streptomyces sp. NPDC097619 TaxID=3157228 RepID=UPI0033251102
MGSAIRGRAAVVNGGPALLLAGGVALTYVSLGDDGTEAPAASRTTTVTRGDLTAQVSASGSVASARTRALTFTGSGTVTAVHVTVGTKVEKGRKPAELDRTEAQEQLDAAKADRAMAADADTTTTQGWAGWVRADNAVKAAQRALDGTVLYAPFAGTVTAVNGSVGGSSSGSGSASGSSSSASSSSSGTTASGSGFIELADPGAVQVTGKFTESDATRLKVGQTATVTFAALSGVTAQGMVAAVDGVPTTENNGVTFGVTVSLKEKPAEVRIGQTATATVTVAEAKDALYVPAAAGTSAGGQSTVTVLQDGAPVVRTVTVGISGTSGTEIKSGLTEGEQVRITAATTTTGGAGGSGQFPGGGLGGGAMPGGGSGGRGPGGGGGR